MVSIDAISGSSYVSSVASRAFLHGHLHEGACRRVHGRLAQLVRIHLAQALEAVVVDPALRDLQDRLPQLTERARVD
jgi:hypothetical protein